MATFREIIKEYDAACEAYESYITGHAAFVDTIVRTFIARTEWKEDWCRPIKFDENNIASDIESLEHHNEVAVLRNGAVAGAYRLQFRHHYWDIVVSARRLDADTFEVQCRRFYGANSLADSCELVRNDVDSLNKYADALSERIKSGVVKDYSPPTILPR